MNEPRSATQWGDRDQRRIDILRSGEDLLRSGGYGALRMRDVAIGAGISLGAVYTYFTNKENLFVGVFAENVLQMTHRLRPQIESSSDFVEVFTAIANEYRQSYPVFGRQLDALVLAGTVDALQPDVEGELRDATGALVTALAAALTRAGYVGDVRPAMTLLWSTITGLAGHYTSARQEFFNFPWDEAVAFSALRLGEGLRLCSGPDSRERGRGSSPPVE